jgi:hypothetical protein
MRYLMLVLLLAAPLYAQESTGATPGTTGPLIRTPTARVTVVLDGNDVRALASIARDLYEFSQTPDGQALIEALHSGGDSNAIADRFMDAFDRYLSLRVSPEPAGNGPAPVAQIPIELHIWYHGPTLEQVVKEVIDEIFVSRPWTRIGRRFPVISMRIREHMVARCNGLYNRIVWRKLREMHPRYLAQVNGEINRFTARFRMDPGQVHLYAFSAYQEGWAGLSLDGRQVFSRSSREIRAAFAEVSEKLADAISNFEKSRNVP